MPRSCVPSDLLAAPIPDLQLLFLLAVWDGMAATRGASQAGAWGDTALVVCPL